MLVERLRKEWRAREWESPIEEAPVFTRDGLVFGCGTVLAAAKSERCLDALDGIELRLLALLAVAYGRVIPLSVLHQIERAAKSWSAGDDCLALIHLALAGLHRVEDRRETARRLFIADGLMRAGISPRTILEALDLPAVEFDDIRKFNLGEPRIPPGSGKPSGEWTRLGSALVELTEEGAEFLMRTAAEEIAEHPFSVAARANPWILAASLVLVPKTTNLSVEGDVPELRGLHFSWKRDETRLLLTYEGEHGIRRVTATLGADRQFRDDDTKQVVATLLPDETLAIDPGAVSNDLADKDGPNLCPKPEKDKEGRVGPVGESDKDYEDQIKRLVNPDNPTPRGYGYNFFNPVTGRPVFIDDCQHKSGNPFEMKRGYLGLLSFPAGRQSLQTDWLDQSERQLNATQGRQLFWIMSKQDSADFARSIFNNKDAGGGNGRENIIIKVVPRTGESP